MDLISLAFISASIFGGATLIRDALNKNGDMIVDAIENQFTQVDPDDDGDNGEPMPEPERPSHLRVVSK